MSMPYFCYGERKISCLYDRPSTTLSHLLIHPPTHLSVFLLVSGLYFPNQQEPQHSYSEKGRKGRRISQKLSGQLSWNIQHRNKMSGQPATEERTLPKLSSDPHSHTKAPTHPHHKHTEFINVLIGEMAELIKRVRT